MIDIRVHIRVKPVFVRRELVPKRFRLLRHELDLRQRFGALESVLPRNNEAKRRSVLVAQRFAVKADYDKRQLVRRLRQSEAFRVGPWKIMAPLFGTIRGIEERTELYIFRLGLRPREIDKFRQQKTVPWETIDQASTQRCR